MRLENALSSFYCSNALCELRLMHSRFVDRSITYNSLLYLDLIYTMKGMCTATKLAELLHISKPGVTTKLNELERQGLIVKKPDPGDKRKIFLEVNEEMVPLYRVFRKQDQKGVKRIEKHFSAEEIGKFCEMLDMLSQINLEEINGT